MDSHQLCGVIKILVAFRNERVVMRVPRYKSAGSRSDGRVLSKQARGVTTVNEDMQVHSTM